MPDDERRRSLPDPDGLDVAEVTAALRRINDAADAAGARDRAMELVYDRLKSMAHALLARGGPAVNMDATALVHDLWLKLAEAEHLELRDRRHFFSLASTAMQQILVDEYRRRRRLKRGGDRDRSELDDLPIATPSLSADLLDLDAALLDLAADDERAALTVRLRLFSGLTIDQIADLLGVSGPTIDREWRAARAWLGHRLTDRR